MVIPSVGNFDVSPYHWMFAVSNTELAGISVTKRSFLNRRAHIVIFNQDLRNQIWRTKASRVPHILGRPDMSRKGAIIAKRLSDKQVPTSCFCSFFSDTVKYLREHTNTRWRTTNTHHNCSVVVDILCYPTGDPIEIYVSTTKHRKSINYTAQMRLSSVLPYLAKKPHSVSTIRLRV